MTALRGSFAFKQDGDIIRHSQDGPTSCWTHLLSAVNLAVGRQKDLLTDGKLSRVDSRVNALDVADSGTGLAGQIEESVAALDVVSLDKALGSSADRDVDEFARVDQVDVLDLLVGGDEGVKGDVVVCGDQAQGVAALDDVAGVDGDGAGGGGRWGGLGEARGVVGGGALGRDLDDLTGDHQVGVFDVVEAGNVADARLVLLGQGAEGVARNDGVVDGGGGTAGECACWGTISQWGLGVDQVDRDGLQVLLPNCGKAAALASANMAE